MRNSKALIIISLLVLILSGCGAKTNLQSLDNVSDKEGIVLGTIRVEMNDQDITQMARLVFDSSGFVTSLKELPEDGFFVFSFNEGKHAITSIEYYEGYPTHALSNKSKNFSFIVEPGSINYLGDIVIKWDVPQEVLMDEASGLNTTASLALGLLGAALTKPKYSKYFNEDVGSVSLVVSYDIEGTQRRVKEKYNRDMQIKVIEMDGSSKID